MKAQDVSDGERVRIAHALDRLEAMVKAMRLAIKDPAPIGFDGPQALLQTAGDIAVHAAAADTALRFKG